MDIAVLNKLGIKLFCIVVYAFVMAYLLGFKTIFELIRNSIKFYKKNIFFKNKI